MNKASRTTLQSGKEVPDVSRAITAVTIRPGPMPPYQADMRMMKKMTMAGVPAPSRTTGIVSSVHPQREHQQGEPVALQPSVLPRQDLPR